MRMATEAKAKAEADAKAKADAAEQDKARLEAELNAKLDAERKAREEAEKRATEAVELARKELEEKAKRDAEELRLRLEEQLRAEMKAKLEEDRKAREEEDRKRREAEDQRRKEEDEERAREDVKRRAREEGDRKKREEEDRKRKEDDDRRRKEDDERRAKEVAERRIREEAEREKRLEEDRKRREEDDRRRKEEDERRAKEEAERKAREDAERKARDEADAKARAAGDLAASLPKVEAIVPPPPPLRPAAPAPAPASDLGDLLGDLDSFGKREEEEQKAKEEAERKAKEEAARRAKEEAERQARDDAERRAKEEADKKRREEEERRAKEEEERKAQEDEARRKEEEAERKRKAKEALAAKQAEERAARAAAKGGSKTSSKDDDIEVSDDDLNTDDLKRDQKVAAERARKVAREQPAVAASGGRPKKWGKPLAIATFVVLIGGIGLLHVMPVSTADYEKAASDAMGVPVKISSARLSLITGVEVKFEGVSIGSAVKIRSVRGSPDVGSLFGPRKSFSRVDLEGVSISQSQVADALLGKVAGGDFRIARITAKQLTLDGPLKLPPLDLDATVAGDGTLQSVKLSGGDKMNVQLQPKGSDIGFEISAGSLALPFVPALSLSEFSMKGTANRAGVTSSEFDGRAFDGVISGTARIRWGDSWAVDGEVRARGVKVAVFAPALVSDGKVEGRAAYNMAGSAPATLFESARMQGEFKIEKGVLGSFDLQRALQSGGAQGAGRTIFNELNGQGVYDKGAVQFSNVSIVAGAMNAGASLNIDTSGGLSGRIVADVKTQNQVLRATLNVAGKVTDPVIRK